MFASDSFVFGLSTINDGDMKINPGADNQASFLRRREFLSQQGLPVDNLVGLFLEHGKEVAIVGEDDRGKIVVSDAAITATPQTILSITAADCLPVYFFDHKKKVIALAHAGWRGVKENIVPLVIEKMNKEFTCSSQDIHVFIGPYIKDCHFEVRADFLPQFSNYPEAVVSRAGKHYLDLGAIVKKQLLESGISDSHIEISPECTYCLNHKYFSYRRDGEPLNVMLAYMMIK